MPLLTTDAEDTFSFVDDRTRRAAEVKLVADLHVIHVLREPSAIWKHRMPEPDFSVESTSRGGGVQMDQASKHFEKNLIKSWQ